MRPIPFLDEAPVRPLRIDMDTDLLRAFVAVAETASFTQAARMLNRTQSAVSMQIRRLEDRMAVRLFDRGPGLVALTRDGEVLLGYARRMLELNDEAYRTIAAGAIAGHVRLGAMDDYATRVLPPLLARFADRHPHVYVEVHTGLSLHLLDRLGGDLDLVLAMHPIRSGAGSVVRVENVVWAAPPDRPVEYDDPLPLALYPQGCLFRQWALNALDADARRWRIAYMSPSLGAVEAAVRAGLAISIFKAGTLPDGLRVLGAASDLPPLPSVEIALHRPAGAQTPTASALADFLTSALKPAPAVEAV